MDLPALTWGDPVDHSNRDERDDPLACPFIIAIDTREQAPWSFTGFRADSQKKFRPLVIHTETKTLQSGDYSIVGFESRLSIERKSLSDAFSTFTTDRERFERELVRLNRMDFAAVVIEAGWEALIAGPQRIDKSELHSQVIGKTVYRSMLAWSQRFPRVHWFPMPSRQLAEHTCFRLLERWWKDEADRVKRLDF